ncbi:MAG: glycosyl hydrolase 115 family protein [Prolixibacteraceae bacterium]|nr:glycosyl hydrolase 115 family protein [Prolixibacteraceae bacterium]
MAACTGSSGFKTNNLELSEQYVTFKKQKNAFAIAEDGQLATIVADANDYPGVFKILNYFKTDVAMVTNAEPKMIIGDIPKEKNIIIVGTLGKSKLIDQLVEAGKIDVTDVRGKWETSLIQVIDQPVEGVEKALVIVGSNKRGTLFGIFDVSRKMGVSPWYWWADVPVIKHEDVYVKYGRYNLGEPKVKYRGIFLNDEEPALGRWAVETYGGFNHQFYEKVFELMLRLKSNYIWPAMWWASFNTDDPQNPILADEMGIVLGSSHHEPMNKAHAEWKANRKGEWNYETNAEVLQQFWREGIERMGNTEVIINMGMRGDGDMAMSAETNIALLEKIVTDQRLIIEEVTGKPASETPQMWALYKEVQDYYDHGMRVPDDVTLLLCDDNWGNIRKLPKPGSPEHPGGYGIYYHFDYVGGPRNYKWLNTMSIPAIWEQMNLAYEHGVRELWLVNVGDLKPMEYPISFWLDYAWNPELIGASDLPAYAKFWAAEQFGQRYAAEIADFLSDYTKFNSRRKPELLSANTYSLHHFNEAENYIREYNTLYEDAKTIASKMPDYYNDAYYQLVLHPIEACSNLNEMYVSLAKNQLYAKQGRVAANNYAKSVKTLYEKDEAITKYYHTKLSDGKWNNMMNQVHIGYTYWQQPEKSVMPEVTLLEIPDEAGMGIAIEGSALAWPNEQAEPVLPVFDPFHKQEFYIDVFNKGKKSIKYNVEQTAWLKIRKEKVNDEKQDRLWVSVDWKKAPEGKAEGEIFISGSDGTTVTVKTNILNPSKAEQKEVRGYVESNGFVAFEAENFSRKQEGTEATWKKIPGLGRTLSGMHPLPVNVLAQKPGAGSPVLEYDFYWFEAGQVKFTAHVSPTLNIYNDEGLEFAVSVDDKDPVLVNIHENFSFRDWEEAVKNNTIYAKTVLQLDQPGNHTLKIWMVDPGIVLQRIVLTNEVFNRYSYLGPPQSVYLD